MILTVDFGSSVTKVALWGARGLEALAGVPLRTAHPRPGWSEQDPHDWWASLTAACATLRAEAPAAFASVDVIGCTGARQTVVLADADGEPLGPAILWSDRRAATEATTLATTLAAAHVTSAATSPSAGAGEPPGPAGDLSAPIDAASVAAKLAWLSDHEAERLDLCTWILSPRDLVAWWLTGVVATDPTMASRSGLYDQAGNVVDELAGDSARRLAPVVPSDRVSGALTVRAAEGLGLTAGTPVVIGAGDRPCEVIGSGATESGPMVSWGTTANVSVPVPRRPDRSVPGLVMSRAADEGWLIEGGLSSAGSLIAWLGRLTGHPPDELGRPGPGVRARCRGGGRRTVVGRGPGSLVAGRRHRRVRRSAAHARTGRAGPGRVRVGGMGPPAVSRGHVPAPAGRARPVRVATGRFRVRCGCVDRCPDRDHRPAGDPSPIRSGRLGRGRGPGRPGRGCGVPPRCHRSARGSDRPRPGGGGGLPVPPPGLGWDVHGRARSGPGTASGRWRSAPRPR